MLPQKVGSLVRTLRTTPPRELTEMVWIRDRNRFRTPYFMRRDFYDWAALSHDPEPKRPRLGPDHILN
jgi:hypothetical protein